MIGGMDMVESYMPRGFECFQVNGTTCVPVHETITL